MPNLDKLLQNSQNFKQLLNTLHRVKIWSEIKQFFANIWSNNKQF